MPPHHRRIDRPPALDRNPHGIAPPIQATVPVSNEAILSARKYEDQVCAGIRPGDVTAKDVAEALKYTSCLLTGPDAAEPAWFAGAIQVALQVALQPINQSLRDIQTDIGIMRRRVAQNYNTRLGTIGFDVVPFPNGEVPTAPPHNLPALVSQNIVYGLSVIHCDAYHLGYFPGNQGGTQIMKKKQILAEIGCVTL